MPGGDDLDALRALCARTSTATAYHVLEAAGYADMFIGGLIAVAGGDAGAGCRFAGSAFTLRFLPRRPDLPSADAGQGANPLRLAIESIGPGEVLVVDAGGDVGGGILGDVLSTRLRARGAAGIVVDGAIRDAAGVREAGLPVLARGIHAAAYRRTLLPADLGQPVRCGGVTVLQGDLIMADGDGVLVLPRAVAGDVVRAAVVHEEDDLLSRRLVAEGHSIEEAYPLSPRLRRQYGRPEH